MTASHLGEVTIELAPAEVRTITSEELGNRWREMTGPIPEAVEVSFNASMDVAGRRCRRPVRGADLDELRAAADEVKARLRNYAGVYEISDSFREGKQEMKLGIKPAAERSGSRCRISDSRCDSLLWRRGAADPARPR